jgi:hypothetical protein
LSRLSTKTTPLENRSDVIVRVNKWGRVDDDIGEKVDDLHDGLVFADQLFDELANQYGIPVVKHRYVIGHSPDNPGIMASYTVTDRVFGVPMEEAIDRSGPVIGVEEVTQHFLALINYHAEVKAKGGPYLADISRNNSQFMYGRTVADSTDQIYLVDIDPIIRKYIPEAPTPESTETFERSLAMIAHSISMAEDVSGYDLKAAKLAYLEKLGEVPQESMYHSYVEALVHSLEDANA